MQDIFVGKWHAASYRTKENYLFLFVPARQIFYF